MSNKLVVVTSCPKCDTKHEIGMVKMKIKRGNKWNTEILSDSERGEGGGVELHFTFGHMIAWQVHWWSIEQEEVENWKKEVERNVLFYDQLNWKGGIDWS